MINEAKLVDDGTLLTVLYSNLRFLFRKYDVASDSTVKLLVRTWKRNNMR